MKHLIPKLQKEFEEETETTETENVEIDNVEEEVVEEETRR